MRQFVAIAMMHLLMPGCSPAPESGAAAQVGAGDNPGAVVLTRSVALTFDDLPGIFRDTSASVAAAASARLLEGLRAGNAHATGFVNEDKLHARAVMTQWLDAGMDLGNHTWAHPDLHTTSLVDFKENVLRGETLTRSLLQERGRVPRYFRHPFLHTGRDRGTRDSLNAFLAQHGYRVAPVTLDNYDYLFARVYDRAAVASRDSVRTAYVTYMDTVFGYYEAQSRTLFGREPRQVLLLHVSQLNADAIVDLLAMMKRRGYAITPLDVALTDSIYESSDNYTGPAGLTWLHRWAMTSGKDRSLFAGEPTVPKWIEERARY